MLDLWKKNLVMWAADGGGSGGGSGDGGTGDGSGQDGDKKNADPGKDGKGAGDDKAGGTDGKMPPADPKDEKKFSQAELEAILKDRMDREKKKADDAAAKAKSEAEAAALKDQQKWQELAEKHAARVQELEAELAASGETLEAESSQVKRLQGALQKFLDEQRMGLPAHIVSLLDKLDAVDQLEYIAANAETLRKAPPGRVPPTPGADGDSKLTAEERRKRSWRARL